MTINPSSLAAGVGVSAVNTNFTVAGTDVPRKILCMGTVDPTLESGLTENAPEIVVNEAHAAKRYGQGFALSKLIEWVRKGGFTGELHAMPQFESAATQSTGEILFGGTCTKAGPLYLRVWGELVYNINIAKGDDGEKVQEKVVAAVALQPNLPVTAVENGVTPEQADFTSNTGATDWDPILSLNDGFGEELPEGITAAITDMSGGAGLPVMATSLAALGSGDQQNENHYTMIVHINGQDSTSLDSLSTWNGIGNEISGNWGKTVCRPIRSLVGDVAAGASGLSDLLTLGGNRKESDRTSGVVAVAGSPSGPFQVAAVAAGVIESVAQLRPGQSYVKKILPGILPGTSSDNWCADYDDRDTAVNAGISPTEVKGGAVMLSNVVTFYHSDSIPVASNAYREMCNISLLQNVVDITKSNFESENWQGISVVADKTLVTNVIDRQKARSVSDVLDDLIALAVQFEGRSWVWSAAFTIGKLQEGGYVQIRPASNGFDIILPIRLRVINNIDDIQIQFDANVAVAL